MPSLWQHQNGTFYVLYGERSRSRASLRTKDRATAQIRFGRFIAGLEHLNPDQPTLAFVLESYRDQRGVDLHSPEAVKYAVQALLPRLGSKQPRDLDDAAIKDYAKKRGAKPGTILREVGTLRAALNWAVRQKLLDAAPHISNPVPAPPPRDRWLTKDEARRLLAECHEPHLRLFVTLALATAARTSAILELRWSQVDFERRTVDYGLGHGNKRRSVVPLNDEAIAALIAADTMKSCEFVIQWHGQRVSSVKKGFAFACRRAGIIGASPHVLRHSAATWMALAGVPMAEIARLLGDTTATVERVYAKHHPDYLRRAASALQFRDESE